MPFLLYRREVKKWPGIATPNHQKIRAGGRVDSPVTRIAWGPDVAAKLPYLQFFPDDWLSDEKLRLCSLAARGLWIDLLSLMHKQDRRGYLQQVSGQPLSPEQISRLTGCSVEEVSPLLRELINSGAASVSSDGVIYSRRMVRDEEIRLIRAEAGSKGGKKKAATNSLLRQNPKQKSSKHVSKTLAKPLANSGYGIGDGSGFAAGSGKEEGGGAGGRGDGFDEFWAAYPRRQAKQDAARAWGKLRPDAELRAKILAALEFQKSWGQWKNGVIPHAATWLNGRRWEDESPQGVQAPQLFRGIADWMAEGGG